MSYVPIVGMEKCLEREKDTLHSCLCDMKILCHTAPKIIIDLSMSSIQLRTIKKSTTLVVA